MGFYDPKADRSFDELVQQLLAEGHQVEVCTRPLEGDTHRLAAVRVNGDLEQWSCYIREWSRRNLSQWAWKYPSTRYHEMWWLTDSGLPLLVLAEPYGVGGKSWGIVGISSTYFLNEQIFERQADALRAGIAQITRVMQEAESKMARLRGEIYKIPEEVVLEEEN
jgi:hypothetical protein